MNTFVKILLVTLERGSHTGFASVASTFMRWFDHPDALVCPMLVNDLEGEGGRSEPMLEPDPAAGISASDSRACATEPFGRAMRPGEQQMLTRLALYAFLEKAFTGDSERRRAMDGYLSAGFGDENAPANVKAPVRVRIQTQ